ncbi:MAG: acyl-CoA dehydrogenase family protein [Caldilineaceae bacterium]|nr:acyl-CoA/acyl-ACP dehydrogenase [Caldilineaceae bacterium]
MIYPRTDRQRHFVALARELAERFQQRAAEYDQTGRFPFENYDDLRQAGLPSLVIPEEFGGWGANLLESVLAMETLATGDGSTALSFTMHVQVMGSAAEARSWPEDLFVRLCRESVDRGALINAVATEPRLGSPSRGGLPDTVAAPVYASDTQANSSQGDPIAWVINGHKNFASLSPALDYFIVPAALQDGSGQVARFVVPAGDHIEIEETWNAMGMRATGSHDIYLRDARVTPDLMLGRSDPKASDPTISTGNAWFTLTVCAVYLGVAQAALSFAANFAHKRVPTALGKPIAELESIQRLLGEAELALIQARSMLYNVANDWDTLPDCRQALSPLLMAAKVTVTNNAIRAVDQSMRVVGGASMSRSLPMERYYRDVRAGLYHPMVDEQAIPMFGRIALQREKGEFGS